VVGLLWQHQQTYWSTSSKPYRRSGFPSWSWAGWAEGVEFIIEAGGNYEYFRSEVFTVYLEFEPGCLLDHSYLFRNSATTELQFCFPQALHLDVWVVSLEKLAIDDLPIQSGCTTRVAGFDARLRLSQGPTNPDDLSEMFGKREWELIVLGTTNFVFLLTRNLLYGY
jgi:hypothetical protein